jgi:3-oxoacyl-[acyl-carrier-protein] synthase-1
MIKIYIGADSIVSPIGLDAEANFAAIISGKSALRVCMPSFSSSPVCAALMDEADLDSAFSAFGDPHRYTRLEKMSLISISQVVKQSGVRLSDKRTLLLYSTTKGNIDLLNEGASEHIPENRVYLPVFGALLGNYFKCANTPVIVSNACISGLLAMIIASRLIRAGKYDHVVVAGGDIVSEFTLSGFRSFNAMSDEACRPYDLSRKGINLGEAAGAVLMTNDKAAAEKTLISFAGGATANDANHISGPSRNGDGLYQAIQDTFMHSDIKQVDYISAHGTATSFNDEMESIAFSRAGLSALPLHSLKGFFGHTLGAAGLIESIIELHALRNGKLIQSPGFKENGVSHKLNIITETKDAQLKSCLKTVSGFGGSNAAGIFVKEEQAS